MLLFDEIVRRSPFADISVGRENHQLILLVHDSSLGYEIPTLPTWMGTMVLLCVPTWLGTMACSCFPTWLGTVGVTFFSL